MKKGIIMSGIFVLMALAMMMAAEALRPNVVVSSFGIKEGSASPGGDFTLLLTLSNTENATCADTITTTLQGGYPFIFTGLSTINSGDLCGIATRTVEVPLRIDPAADGGYYQLTVTNDYETPTQAQYSSTSVLNLVVEGSPELNANIIGSNPVDVYPGDTAQLSVSIHNDGSFGAQNVNATLRAELPVEVKWSGSFASVGNLAAHQAKTSGFTIDVPKDSPSQDYPLVLEIHYLDENHQERVNDIIFIFHVKKKALFSISDAASNTLYPNQNSRLVKLSITNKGTDTARNVKLKLLPQYPFSTDGSVRYISSLAPGASTQSVFSLDTDKDGTLGTYELDMLVTFEDAQGNTLQDTVPVPLTIRSESILRSVFLDYWLLWTVAIVAGFIIYRRRKAKKHMDKR